MNFSSGIGLKKPTPSTAASDPDGEAQLAMATIRVIKSTFFMFD
jgi:hypothetical protein